MNLENLLWVNLAAVLHLLIYNVNLPFVVFWSVVYLPFKVDSAVDGIGWDAINPYGIELGELSMPQLLIFVIIILQMVVMYSVGIFPFELQQFINSRRVRSSDQISNILSRSEPSDQNAVSICPLLISNRVRQTSLD